VNIKQLSASLQQLSAGHQQVASTAGSKKTGWWSYPPLSSINYSPSVKPRRIYTYTKPSA
jgi:heme/copper-type cytochrome/quinol oxidase subunit 1